MWMLTGDKVETATCIAISAGFKQRTQKLFFMKEIDNTIDAKALLNEFDKRDDNVLLMIDG